MRPQIRDLNSGTFGFVELALDKTTGQQVAIKFIERGDKARGKGPFARPPRPAPLPSRPGFTPATQCLHPLWGAVFCSMLGSLRLF